MIPIRLTLENFMCYREGVPTLDLEDIHIACLSGDNGHGKTALLDSITWALWGKARSRTQEELVHQGQRTMRVELDFSANNQMYRVTRIHTRSVSGSQGKTDLNLSVLNDDSSTSLMGNTIRDTEEQINNLIHMDYDTFVSTSYIRQGDADHFTRSRPAERKQILAEVLNLSYYERLENASKDKARLLRSSIDTGKAIIEARNLDVAGKSNLHQELKAAEEKINALLPLEKEAAELVAQLAVKEERYDRNELEETRLTEAILKSSTELSELKSQSSTFFTELTQLDSLLDRSEEITATKLELDKYRTILSDMAKDLNTLRELENNSARIERDIALSEQSISREIEIMHKRLTSEVKPAIENTRVLNEEVSEIEAILQANNSAVNKLQENVVVQKGFEDEIKELEIHNKSLMAEMENTRNRFDMLEGSLIHCPLCAQPLDEDGKQHLTKELESKGNKSKHIYNQNKSRIEQLSKKLRTFSERFRSASANLSTQKEELTRELIRTKGSLADQKKLASEKPELEGNLKVLVESHKDKRFAQKQYSDLSEINLKIGQIGYDRNKHTQIEEKTHLLEPYAELYSQLGQAKERHSSLSNFISTNNASSSRREHEIAAWDADLNELRSQQIELSKAKQQLMQARVNSDRLRVELQTAISSRDVSLDKLNTIKTIEKEIHIVQKEVQENHEEEQIYEELSAAFGKNGIQALMIERAVPQLQEISNDLLGKLTDNRMAIKFELVEGRTDRQTGLPSEELEINISDEIGTRSYETFSGGEAFRIDFAIRISLSKLLAARAGAPLPILFIDEGFGSQDADGQGRLTDVIQSIQSQFEKIIVITHIDQMKDTFEDRIEVLKTQYGSTFSII